MQDGKELAAEIRVAVENTHRAARASNAEIPRLQSATALGHVADEGTLRLIASLVREIAPRHVIEFGCGPATELLAQMGFDHGRLAVTTFEHDPWAAREVLLHANPFAINYRWFSFCLCPLVARRIGGALAPVYDDGLTTSTVSYPADLLVIQGPPKELGGRAGMLYQALKYARSGSVLLLLDVRAEEEQLIDAWMDDLAGHLLFVPPGLLGRHLAFVVREPLLEPFSLEGPRAQELAWASGRVAPAAES